MPTASPFGNLQVSTAINGSGLGQIILSADEQNYIIAASDNRRVIQTNLDGTSASVLFTLNSSLSPFYSTSARGFIVGITYNPSKTKFIIAIAGSAAYPSVGDYILESDLDGTNVVVKMDDTTQLSDISEKALQAPQCITLTADQQYYLITMYSQYSGNTRRIIKVPVNDMSNPTVFTTNALFGSISPEQLSYKPDGNFIFPGYGGNSIYTMNSDGTNVSVLYTAANIGVSLPWGPIGMTRTKDGTGYLITGYDSKNIKFVDITFSSSPAAPTSLAASAGDQSVSVSFTPGSDNGSPITNYKYSTDNGSTYTACSPAVTSSPVVITGLTNGQSYSIKLLAVNSLGDGTPSTTVTATPHAVPDAPTNLVASYNGSGSVSISFTPGSNGGETITNYQYSIDCGSTFSPLNPVDGISPVTISGLTNGQTYCIELKAVNSVGAGIASSSVEYTASGLPAAPTSISWTDVYNGDISVSFTPGSDEGSSILNYEYSLNGGSTFTTLSPAQTSSPIIISGLTNRTNYSLVLRANNTNGAGASSSPIALYYMCFLEGSKILCYDSVAQQEVERPVETLRKGDLVKTTMDGYKAIDTIGTSKIYNPGNSMRSKNRLYRLTKEKYPELKEDLVITGCHAVLVSDLSEQERRDLLDIQGKVYVTEDYYRLIACCDKRAVPYEKEGLFNIWHFALENNDYYFNYGVYANGLKVETASKRMMKEMSGMDLL